MAKQTGFSNRSAKALMEEFFGAEVIEDEKASKKAADRQERRPKKTKDGDPYQRLALAAKGRISEVLEDMDWVFDNASLSPEDVEPDSVPSPGAVGLLKWLHESPNALDKFYATMWPRRFPSRKELDDEQRMRDDGQVIDLIDRVSRAAKRAEAIEEDAEE